jgi:hypothetical protein
VKLRVGNLQQKRKYLPGGVGFQSISPGVETKAKVLVNRLPVLQDEVSTVVISAATVESRKKGLVDLISLTPELAQRGAV